MELNERETLVKVEQQLKNSIENQAQIVSDMREIFNRIESQSKILAGVKGDLQTHLETSTVQRESCNSKIGNNTRDLENILTKIKNIEERQENNQKEIRTALGCEEDAREEIDRDYALFKENLKVSVRHFKLITGTIVGIATILTPYITLVLKELLDK